MFGVERNSFDLYHSVNVTDDGRKALMSLAGGDMRKTLNILQVGMHMSLNRVSQVLFIKLNFMICKLSLSISVYWTLLNVQSSAMAYDVVNEDNVYTCVGHPLRKDIENIVNWMLNESFTTAYNRILLVVAILSWSV